MKIHNLMLGTVALIGLTVISTNIASPKIANAEANRHVIYVSDKTGEITFDESGKVIDSSDSSLLNDDEVTPAKSVNNAYGRWVYYSDGIGSGRTGHSNFYSTKGHHYSWVKMGSKSKKKVYANSNAYSYASQKGSGTFKCGYGLG